jgi:hypothetical protein
LHVWDHYDNIAVVYIINKQTSKDPTIMILVRRLVLPILKFNILFKASHIAGIKNIAADQLSRLQTAILSEKLDTFVSQQITP